MEEILFELKDIHYAYLAKFPALCGIDMRIRVGEKIAIIGANGTGKSTLLHMLDGLIFPDAGTVRAFGKELKEDNFSEEEFSRYFRSRVGFVFQNPDVQLFSPSVKEDIVFGPLQLGVSPEEVKRRLGELTEFFCLHDLLERAPYQLSIGEKRRVAIASTLAVEPEVLILDEPTAGLDPRTCRQIIDIILEANEKGKTVITATHDLHLVAEIADTVYVLGGDRKIARSGPTLDILADNRLLEQHNLAHIHTHRHKGQMHTHPHCHLDHHNAE